MRLKNYALLAVQHVSVFKLKITEVVSIKKARSGKLKGLQQESRPKHAT